MKYVVLKGIEGFADRMECLFHAVEYAFATGRTLVVDWRDPDWAHEQTRDFDYYFRITGVSTLTYRELEEQVTCFSKQDIYPEAWHGLIFESDYRDFVRKSEFGFPGQSELETTPLERIIDGEADDYRERVVVYAGYGTRRYRAGYFSFVHMQNEIRRKVEKVLLHEWGKEFGAYDVIHLRGGSKPWMGGEIRIDSPVRQDHYHWNSIEEYLEYLKSVFMTVKGSQYDLPVRLVSDTYGLAEKWVKMFGFGEARQRKTGNIIRESGIHKLSATDLENVNTTKEELNIEMLADFITMINARILIGDDVSRYSLLALRLKKHGVRL